MLGVIFYQYADLYQGSFYALLSIALLMLCFSFVKTDSLLQFKFRWVFGVGISLLLFVFAYFLSDQNEKQKVFDHLDNTAFFRVELVSAPIEKANSYLCQVSVIQTFDSLTWKPSSGKAIVYLQKDSAASKLLFGDRVIMRAKFNSPEKALNPDGFDFAAYLHRQGIVATSYVSSENWQLNDKSSDFSIRREADKCRKYLLHIYRKFNIENDEFAVLSALTLGYSDALEPDLRTSYSATGAMHILSVSGMHVGIVYVVLAFVLSFLNKNQRQKVYKTLIITLFLWLYAFLTGLSPSVVRAALMLSFVSVATCFERKSQIYNTLFMSAFFMLVYNPNFLYDVGFQLSYAAVLSIVFFQPIIGKLYLAKNRYSKFCWDLFSVSLAAQLGTVPFTLYYFQQFPNYFILTNFVAIPLSTIVIYLAILLFVVSFLPYISTFVSFLLKWSLWLLNFMIVWIQHLPYSVSHFSFDLKQTVVICVGIFCFSAYFFSRKFSLLFVGFSCVLIVSIFSLVTTFQTLTTKRMIVFAGQKNTHVNFIERNQNFVFSTDSVEMVKIAKCFWQNQKLESPKFNVNNNWVAQNVAEFNGSRIIVLNKDYLRKTTYLEPLQIDYLIIGNSLKPKIDQVLSCLHPRKIVVDKTISKWYSQSIRQACKARNIDFYSVAERGAYILTFTD